jgi:hypothetical protein
MDDAALFRRMSFIRMSFIVDNRPRAGGRLALGVLKGGPVDGTAMILTPASNVAVFPHVYRVFQAFVMPSV